MGRTGSSSSSLLLREESEDEVKGLPKRLTIFIKAEGSSSMATSW